MLLLKSLFLISLLYINAIAGYASPRTIRGADGLAPEINKRHDLRYKRDTGTQVYTVMFYDDCTEFERAAFLDEFNEFLDHDFERFSFVHMEIPDSLSEDVIFEMRSKPFVDSIVHEVLIESSSWNKDRISAAKPSDVVYDNGIFEGNGQ
eukprot:Awhi_evm1s7023